MYVCTGCPKKTQLSGILAITPLWKGLELKVGSVSKTSGNSLCDRHKNFPNFCAYHIENFLNFFGGTLYMYIAPRTGATPLGNGNLKKTEGLYGRLTFQQSNKDDGCDGFGIFGSYSFLPSS